MRFLYGIIAVMGWMAVITFVVAKGGLEMPSNDVQILTTAIVAAGAMAGGD